MVLVFFLLDIKVRLPHMLKNPFMDLIHMISRGSVWGLILLWGVNRDDVSGKPVMEETHRHSSCLT